MTLSELLTVRARKTPGKTCIKFENLKLSYAEMDRRVTLTAGGLKAEGLKNNDRVAILMDNCPEYIILYFAILRAGAVVIPVNTFLAPNEVVYILKDSGCKFLLYNDKFERNIEEIKSKSHEVNVLAFDDIQQTETQPYAGDKDDIAVLLYTSGTTGFPKGAMLTHENLLSNAESCIEAMQVTHNDKVLLFLPLFHSFSFTVCVVLPIFAGSSIVLLASVKPFSRVVDSILKDRITLFVAVPAVYNILANKKLSLIAKLLIRFLVKVRLCISGASALPEATINAFEKRYNIPLIEGYGLTEASPVVAVNRPAGIRKPMSVGPPLPGIKVSVIAEDGTRLSSGETGELIVEGPNVMKGYFNKEEETNAVLNGSWLHTGDMARIDQEGHIFIVDRKKDLIIVDGMNIYPREVEDLVCRHPYVEECAMVGIPDGKGSEMTCLYVKQKEGASVDGSEVRAHMKGNIARFKIPRRIKFIEEFPKTATGKIIKAELRKLKL